MTNRIRQQESDELNKQLLDELQTIERVLRESESAEIDPSVDKQILAAAYRESQLPRNTSEYRFTVWRKLSLPLYIASGFVFTVLAYNTLLLPNREEFHADESASTIISIESSEVSTESLSAPQIRQKRELPTLQSPEQLPERVVTESSSSAIEIGSSNEQQRQLIDQGIYTGNQLKKAEFPEKEAWAREIIVLLRSGDTQTAKSELNEFKKIYPDYPIEEQIKVLTH
jgi:ribulose bisphosphate carboxylase small subunit